MKRDRLNPSFYRLPQGRSGTRLIVLWLPCCCPYPPATPTALHMSGSGAWYCSQHTLYSKHLEHSKAESLQQHQQILLQYFRCLHLNHPAVVSSLLSGQQHNKRGVEYALLLCSHRKVSVIIFILRHTHVPDQTEMGSPMFVRTVDCIERKSNQDPNDSIARKASPRSSVFFSYVPEASPKPSYLHTSSARTVVSIAY